MDEENILTINKDYRLVSDRYSWTLQKYNGLSKDNKPIWKNQGYYPTLSSALEGISEVEFKKCKDIKEVVVKIKELREFFEDFTRVK